MKRLMIILFAIGMTTISSTGMAAMSKSQVRKEARFLTDKMAYELDLSIGQRNDAYEINYDFIYSVRDLMDDVIYGEEWAMNRYYHLLDIRNDDLRWVLSERQYRGFMQADYFFRPIYASGNKWSFRIYITYSNRNHFFFGKPYHYTTYHFVHHRPYNSHVSYYRGRYDHQSYKRSPGMSEPKVNNSYRRSDFNPVTIRPNTSRPKEVVNTNRRPATSNSGSSSVRVSTGSEQHNKVNTGSGTNKRSVGTSSRKSSAPSVNSGSSDSGSKRSSVSSSSDSGSKRSSVSGSSDSGSKRSSVGSSSGSSTNKSSSTSGSSSRSRSSESSSSSTGSKSRR